jgi:hypothetical protein
VNACAAGRNQLDNHEILPASRDWNSRAAATFVYDTEVREGG